MKSKLSLSIALLGLAAALPSRGTEINLPDLSATPDGTTKVDFQHNDVNTPNGGQVLPTGTPKTAYVITRFNFGTASDAHLQWQFSTSATSANRIGLEVQDTGLFQTLGTGNGILQAISPTTPKRTTVNLNQDMAGQTVTLLAKLHYDSNLSVVYDARSSFNGAQSTGDDTLMNVWINPDETDVEGSGITAGDLYALWNSAGFSYLRQTIQNQSTPGTAGDSSITDTVVLTGADATFTKALAIATGATPGVVGAYTSTVSASPTTVPADGVTTSTVTVTLLDGFGDPVAAKDVTLANTAGPQAAVIDPLTAVTTDSNGQATFTVKSSTSGIEEFTATDVTDSLVINQKANVAFISAADPALSTVVASPTYVNANGTSTSTITVTLIATGNVPTPGKEVSLAGLPATATITPPGSQVTDSNGQVTFAVSSNTPGQVVFTATNVTDGFAVTQTASVDFAGPAAAGTSTVTASAAAVVANGTSTSTITVSLKDSAGIPVVGEEVTLAGLPAIATLDPVGSQFTDANGQCVFTVSSTSGGLVEFTATAVGASVVVSDTATVEFIDSSVPLSFNVSFVQFTPGLGDFEDPATLEGPSGGSGETWNQIRAASGANLSGSNGEVTSVGVATNFSECRQRNDSGLVLLRDGLTDFTKGLTRTVTISGLPPGSLYGVWLASGVSYGGTENGNGTFSTSNPTSTVGGQTIDQTVSANTATWEEGNNYVLFENVVVDGSGQIQITASAAVGYRLPLNGFQLVPASKGRIVAFEAAGATGVIDQEAFTIAVTVPNGTDLATLAPTFTLNSGTCNQTSGSPPSPTFAAQNPATYTVTDDSTDPDTINAYTVTVTVAPPPPVTTTLVIDLGTSPGGTLIAGGAFIGTGPTNLPIPTLPAGSILRSIAVNAKLEATTSGNFASDLTVLVDTSDPYTGDNFSLGITSGGATASFSPDETLEWSGGNGGVGTFLTEAKTDADWTGDIDLATTGLFLGNAYAAGDGTWSGTITLTYEVPGGGSGYASWANGAPFGGDKNGDGVANGLAFLLGAADPDANAIGLLPAATRSGGDLVLSFSCRNAASRGASTLSVQHSSDLGASDPWLGAAVPDTGGTSGPVNGITFNVTLGDPLNTVTATIASGQANAGKLFGRLSGTE